MAFNTPRSLTSILVSNPWYYDSRACFISFKIDGTGELWCGGELAIYIVYEFDWKISTPEYLHQPIDPNGNREKGGNVHPLAQFTLEITRRRGPLHERTNQPVRIDDRLADSVFEEKQTYKVGLEKGRFPAPIIANRLHEFPGSEMLGLRLVFDRSPYPGAKDWRPGALQVSGINGMVGARQFVSHSIGSFNGSLVDRCIVG
ncbi:hypothetical protein SI65_08808 [Aspergillus cristatus]|uniref:Uncharacterized protein n=1 Tax=Aspergillus cristatus TaxID=573508 RepID=A0A1E3B3S5_ASPCR|nr:hypothetical protein SI65_08808 [Aspergillus cristatus]